MKNIFSVTLVIILAISLVFVFFNFDSIKNQNNNYLKVSDVIKNKGLYLDKNIQISGVPGCTQFKTEYFNYYKLYLRNNDNPFEGIYVNFDLNVGQKKDLINEDIKYQYESYLIMIDGEKNCYDILNKISIKNSSNKIIVEGYLMKTFNGEDLELRLT